MWRRSYKLNSQLTLMGHSRSAEMTCFYIPELNWYFDAGVWSNFRADHIAITHCHGDHIQCLNGIIASQTGDQKAQVYCPGGTAVLLRRYLDSYQQLNSLNPRLKTDKYVDLIEVKAGSQQLVSISGRPFCMEIVECDHSVDTVGYGLCEMRKRLKPEYVGKTQTELISLKTGGTEIDHLVQMPVVMYLGDTTHKVFANESISRYPVIIVECTFLEPTEIKEAESRRHMHWQNLEPVIKSMPKTTFILTHFSLRYTDRQVTEYFAKYVKLYPNLVIWTDKDTIRNH